MYSGDGVACATCDPGSEPLSNRTACQACSVVSDAHVSATGDMCTRCDVGAEPTAVMTACVGCSAKTDSFWYSSAGSPCVRCPAGSEPNAQRSACVDCVDSYSSDGRECFPCAPGVGPSSNRTTCEPCTGIQYSANGLCEICLPPAIVNTDRTLCAVPYQCPAGQFCDSILNPAGCTALPECDQCSAGSVSAAGGSCVPCTGVAAEQSRVAEQTAAAAELEAQHQKSIGSDGSFNVRRPSQVTAMKEMVEAAC